MEVQFAQYSVPVILTVVLGLLYKTAGTALTDRYKPLIAVLFGVVLGLLGIAYKGLPWDLVNVVDHAIYGLMIGASAVGLYELQRTVTKPRT